MRSNQARSEEADYAAQEKRIHDLKQALEEEAAAARKALQHQTQQYNAVQLMAKKKMQHQQQLTEAQLKQQVTPLPLCAVCCVLCAVCCAVLCCADRWRCGAVWCAGDRGATEQ